MRTNETKIELMPRRLYIYERDAIWYAYILTDSGKRIRRSLKTPALQKAKEKAFEMLSRVDQDGSLALSSFEHVKFNKAVQDYRKLLLFRFGTISKNNQNSLRFLSLHFGNTEIRSISTAKVREYQKQRESFWSSEKGKQLKKRHGFHGKTNPTRTISPWTIKREIYCLKGVLNHAVRNGYLEPSQLPDFDTILAHKSLRNLTSQRESLTNSEITKISNWLRADIRKHEADWHSSNKEYHLRKLLQKSALLMFQHLMLKLFLRPQEAKHLRFSDLELVTLDNRHVVQLTLRKEISKVSKKHVRFSVEYSQLEKDKDSVLWSHIQKYREILSRYIEIDDSTELFLRPDASGIYNVSSCYNDYLKSHQISKTAYSLRHHAISKALLHGIPVAIVCEVAQTSETMIMKHYKSLLAKNVHDVALSNMRNFYKITNE